MDIMAGFEPEDVRRIARVLVDGGVGIIPTDTVYGIAALAADEAAVRRVMEIKRRPPDKPLPVLVESVREAGVLAEAEGEAAAALMREFWPGALTIVMSRRRGPGAHLPLQDERSIGLRIPDELFCLALVEHAGYLVAPSANLPGEPAPSRLEDVHDDILERVDFSVNAGACATGVESTVVDITSGVRVLREGAVPASRVMEVAGT
jgi:L-threonylcarbamoyladenylate synthase